MIVEASIHEKIGEAGGAIIDGINFRHYYAGNALSFGQPTTIKNCIFEHIWDTAIQVNFHAQPFVIENNIFRDIHNAAINVNEDPNQQSKSEIKGNRFERIGDVPGYGGSGTWHSAAVKLVNGTGHQTSLQPF